MTSNYCDDFILNMVGVKVPGVSKVETNEDNINSVRLQFTPRTGYSNMWYRCHYVTVIIIIIVIVVIIFCMVHQISYRPIL